MALVLCTSLDHGDTLEAIFRDAGMNTIFISGATGITDREDTFKALEKGQLDVLVSSSIMDVGVDIPGLSLIINAGAGKARSKAIQKVGRGVRNAEGKDDLVFVDIFDYSNKTLREHSMSRLKAYEKEGGYQIITLELSELDQK
jgi:superfamily II DNA or RNA helicase